MTFSAIHGIKVVQEFVLYGAVEPLIQQ